MIGSGVLLGLGALFALVLGALGYGRAQRRAGAKENQSEARETDHEKADALRDRVERELPDRLRDFDDAGYRD